MVDNTNKTIGEYQIIEFIGETDSTIVYKGYHSNTERYVAVKVLKPGLARDPAAVQQFLQQAELVAPMAHPNILPVYDFGQADGVVYQVAPYIETGTLHDRLNEFYDPRQAQALVQGLAEGLEYIHAQNYIHGNLKSSNIFLDEARRPLLADFAMRPLPGAQPTPYLAPEQVQGGVVDRRADVFALGVLLYEMLVGELPPSGTMVNPRAKRPDLPPAVEQVILKALAQNPDQRYPSAAAFRDALNAALPTPEPRRTNWWLIAIIALLLVMAMCIGAFLVIPRVFEQLAPTPSLTLTATQTATATAPATATNTPEPIDKVWERIQSEGKMRVGISADYPPFSYVDRDFFIKGFDLAVIQEIGRRMDISLDIRDMAFDGLLNAIQVDQIDVAIAAISYTPQRDAYIDFTNVYYVGKDALLANQESNIAIARVEDLARYQVGVQSGSVHETWLRDTLVKPGLMPPQFLVTFQTPEEAVDALLGANPRVQFVLLDNLPAEVAERAKPVKIIMRDLNPQLYAIAIPQEAVTLQARLNEELDRMQKDGTMDKLASEYLNVDNLIPPPTPLPTAPPATPETCLDGMQYIGDLNYPDNGMASPPQFDPGANINKGWRIRNTGTCTWDSGYVLSYVGSNPPNAPVGGNPVAIQGSVAPGQTYDVYVNLVAPYQPGRYQSFWQLRNGDGMFFGDRLYAGFDVIGQVTATAPPAPVIYRFTANPRTVTVGQCVTLGWQFEGPGPLLARLFRNNDLLLLDLPYNGSFSDCPSLTGTVEYHLVVDSQVSGSARASQLVNIIPAEQPTPTPQPTEEPPVIEFFDTDREEIPLGECVNLSWSYSSASLAASQLLRNGEVIANDPSPSGSQQDCPPSGGQIEYILKVDSEFSGSVQQSLFINVLAPEPRTPSMLMNPPARLIQMFVFAFSRAF